MNETPTEQSAHPDELLPWFVSGTLADEERHEVEQHVASCLTCQQEITLLERIRTQVKATPTQSPGEAGLTRFLREVHEEQAVTRAPAEPPSWGWRTGLAIAASFIIFIQAGLLIDVWFLSKPILPLAGPQAQSSVLQITFEPSVTEAQIRQTMDQIHATFIDGPSSLGIYRVRIEGAEAEPSSTDKAIHHLRQQTTVIRHVAHD